MRNEFKNWKDSVKRYIQLCILHHQIKKAQRELERKIDTTHPFEDLFMNKKGSLN